MLCLEDDVTLIKKGLVLVVRLLYKSEGSVCCRDWRVFNVVKSSKETVRSTVSPETCYGGYLPNQVPAVGTVEIFLSNGLGFLLWCYTVVDRLLKDNFSRWRGGMVLWAGRTCTLPFCSHSHLTPRKCPEGHGRLGLMGSAM